MPTDFNINLKLLDDAADQLARQGGARQVTRELIVSYATVAAFVQHWPSRASAEARKQVLEFAWIREVEYDRYVKQRRIALARLSADPSVARAAAL